MWYRLSVLASLLVSAGSVVGHDSDLIVSTTSRPVQGYSDTNTTSVKLNKWLGIPFAQDTSGKNRWRAPQHLLVSRKIFNATAYGPACMQGRCVSWRQSHILRLHRAEQMVVMEPPSKAKTVSVSTSSLLPVPQTYPSICTLSVYHNIF